MAIPPPYPHPGSQGPGTPQEQEKLPEVRPARIWYWAGALLLPLGLLLTVVILLAGGRSAPGVWLLLAPASIVVSTAWIVAVYMLRDRSERQRRSLLPPPPVLMHAATYPGGPVYPVWFQPRSMPPLEPKNVRPRRFWYGIAVLLLVLMFPATSIIGNVVGDAAGILLSLLCIFGIPALCIVVMVKRAGHRKRIAREHLAKEWEQAHQR